MSSRRNELAEKAVTVLATAWVVLCGGAASVFLIVQGSTTPTQTLLIFAGTSAGAGFLLWLLRERNPLIPRASMFAWFRRPKTKTVHYQLKVRKTARDPNEPPPQPPTVERLRQLADEGPGTWVPSRTPKSERDKKS